MPPDHAAIPEPAPQLSRQRPRVRVLHSNERPGLTPVFGSTLPPSGLSGRLRTLAFRYGEGDLRHWMLLMLADRIDVAEGLLSDLSRGRVPNVFSEMGLAMEWRHNRGPFVAKVVAASAVVALAVYWLRRR